MKRTVIFAVSLFAVVFGSVQCKSTSDEELVAKFQADMQALVADYNAEIERISTDTTLTDDSRMEAISECYDSTTGTLVDMGRDIIGKYPSKSVAVAALQEIYMFLEPDEAEALLNQIQSPADTAQFVVSLRESIAAKKSTAEGKMFTDFTVVQDPDNAEESTVRFSDYVGKGKYVLVDFWASWCGPCKAEIPNIVSVYEKYAGDDFDVLSVAVWDDPEDTKAAAKEHGVVWNQIINAQQIPTDLYGIEGIPHIMLVGPDGTILKRDLRGEAIEEAVSEALGR